MTKTTILSVLIFLICTPAFAATDGWMSDDKNPENICPAHRVCRSWYNHDKKITEAHDMGPDHPVCWALETNFGILDYLPCPNNGERTSHTGSKWTLRVMRWGDNDQLSYGFSEKDCKKTMLKYLSAIGLSSAGMDVDFKGQPKGAECSQDGSQK